MKILRKYNLKTIIVSLVCVGLIAAFCQPMEGAQSKPDLAIWLQANTCINLSPQKVQELSKLSQSNLDINSIFKQAGKIISNDNGKTNTSSDIPLVSFHQYLMMKWSMYHFGQQMNAVSGISKNIEDKILLMNEPLAISDVSHVLMKCETDNTPQFFEKGLYIYSKETIVPLIDEISIGAP